MTRTLGVLIGAVMFVIGTVWTLQGLDVLEGSGMSGVTAWAIIGPVVAGLGVALLIVVLRPRS